MDPTYNQICQGQTLGAPMLEVSEIGATHGTQQVCYQFGQGQASYTSVGAIHGEPEIGGTYGIQQAYNQSPNSWTTGASMISMLKVPEIGSPNRIQQGCYQFDNTSVGLGFETSPITGGNDEVQQDYSQIDNGQNFRTTRASMLKVSEIGSTNRIQRDFPVRTIIHGGPEIGGTYGIQQAYNQSPNSWTIGASMLKVPEIGRTNRIQPDGNELNILRSGSLSGHHQAVSVPLKTAQKALDFSGTELLEGDEEEEASQTYHNQHSPYAGEQTGACCHRPHRTVRKKKVIPGTRVLNENILSCKSGSDANNLNGKAVLGSLTPKERKRLTDRRHRAKVKAKNLKLRDDFESVSKENDKLKELLLLKNHGQPNVSSKRKAVFEFNDANNAEAMKIVGGLPGMVKITLNVKKRRLKLKGDFDVKALLPKLKMCCDARLISNEDVSAMPGPSTSARLRVPAVQLR